MLTGTAPNVAYTPEANYFGPDSFTFKANDGAGDSNTATVSITVDQVNDAPVAADQNVSTNEDASRAITLSAVDIEGDSLTYSILAAPTHGMLTGTAPNVTYTPELNYSGPDSFTFKANDGTVDSNTATVSLTVDPINDAPVAGNQNVSTNEDTGKAVTLSVIDGDGDSLTYNVVTPPTNGTLTGTAPNVVYTPNANYNGPDSFTFKANDGTADSNTATISITVVAQNDPPVAQGNKTVNVTEDAANTPLGITAPTDSDGDALTITVAAVPNAAKGSVRLSGGGAAVANGQTLTSGQLTGLEFDPAANANGAAGTFAYTVSDGNGGSAAQTVTLSITSVNDAPVATGLDVATNEDTAKGITLSATDADGDGLTYSIVAAPTHGMLTGTAPNVTYTPEANYFGPDSFTFKANDGTADSNTAAVSITVGPANDAPVAANQNVSTNEDIAKAITLSATDADGNSLTYSVVASPMNGMLTGTAPNVTYTPNANYTGPDSFTFKANDGTADSNTATVSITVDAVNDAPVAANQDVSTNEDTAQAITLAATDVEGDSLTYSVVAGPANGTLSGTAPNVTYTPDANYNGPDSFTFKANDGTVDSSTATVTLSVMPVNDAPNAVPQSVTTAEDIAKAITLVATDVDGDALTYAIVTGPMNGTLTGTAPDLTYTPAADYQGPDSFTFKANDGIADSNTATVTLTVTAANDAPAAAADKYMTLQATPLMVAAPGVLSNDTDPEGDALTAELVTGPSHGTLSLQPDGSFTYTPRVGFSGADAFTYRVSDSAAMSSPATVTITVDGFPTSTPGARVNGSGKVTVDGVAVKFKVKADYRRRLTGTLTFEDRDPARRVKKAVVTAVVVSGRHARIFGTATLGDRTTVPFAADLNDPLPGAGVDQFGLELGNGQNVPSSSVKGKITIRP
jgi:VCBS repeat-containing protein